MAVKTSGPQVVFEDADLLVVDKPGGMVCHSAQRPEFSSLADWLRAQGLATPRLINRLDRETSGLVLVAKTERAATILGKQVLRRELAKEYRAIVWGAVAAERGVIDQPIALSRAAPVYTRREVQAGGQASATEYEVVERLVGFTLLRLTLRTGRTHQLRVHLSWLGHPIVGDKIYGPDERWYLEFIAHGVTEPMLRALLLPRHALHAAAVAFTHPTTGQRQTVRAELPEDLAEFIEAHR